MNLRVSESNAIEAGKQSCGRDGGLKCEVQVLQEEKEMMV